MGCPLFIQSSEGRAVFCLSEILDRNAEENKPIWKVVDVCLAEQDSANGEKTKPDISDDSPDWI